LPECIILKRSKAALLQNGVPCFFLFYIPVCVFKHKAASFLKKYTMPHISIISSSVRNDRKSQRIALYFKKYLESNNLATAEILDLKEYGFPVFEDTLKTQKNPSAEVLDFAEKIKSADGIIIVTPEYNGGYPASLKNAIDLLYEEWHRKPISICTVSAGAFGGTQALLALQFTLWKIGAWTVTNMFCVSNVAKTYDELGNPADKEATDKLAAAYIKELLESISANKLAAIA
jgi:NAD(P)H-dependent FMN reductase